MIAHLRGKLTVKDPTYVVVDCSGVGYLVRISLFTYEKLVNETEALIHTVFHVKDDGHHLFGFATTDEKKIFEQLLAVQGVGASIALAMLSAAQPVELRRMIVAKDVPALRKIKGIGLKTAERIVLELKDKFLEDGVGTATLQSTTPASLLRQEALQALSNLGFPKAQVEKKLDELLRDNPTQTLESLIKAVLKSGS